MSVLAAENGAQLWVRGNIKTQLKADINIVERRERGAAVRARPAGSQPPPSSASVQLSQVSGSQCRKVISNILCLDCCLDSYGLTFKSLKRQLQGYIKE